MNAIIPPLALDGASLTIRKFADKKLTTDDLIGFGSMTREMALFLEEAVRVRKNILVSGGTGSGKTTLLNVLSQFIPPGERVVTVEDSAELKLSHRNIVRLEARPSNTEGKGRVAIRDLVINCLRMRPDRIIVGECRGAEALDMLQAMNTGHDGSLTTAHANNPREEAAAAVVGHPRTDRRRHRPHCPADAPSRRFAQDRGDFGSDGARGGRHPAAGHLHLRAGGVRRTGPGGGPPHGNRQHPLFRRRAAQERKPEDRHVGLRAEDMKGKPA